MNNVYSSSNQANWTGAAPFDHASGIWGRGRFIEYLADRVELGASIVDLGCGAGLPTTYLSSMVGSRGKVVGIDNSQPLVRAAKHFEDNFSNIRFDIGSLDQPLPLDTGTVDWFVSFMTLQNLTGSQRQRMFGECNRCLRRGGKMAHLTLHPNFFTEEWALDFVRYDAAGLERWRTMRSTSFRVDGIVKAREGGQKPVFAYPFTKFDLENEIQEHGLQINNDVEIYVDHEKARRLFPKSSQESLPKGPMFWILEMSSGQP
jgi:SAM-dependent methyltransferase